MSPSTFLFAVTTLCSLYFRCIDGTVNSGSQLVLYSDPLTSLNQNWMSSGSVRIASSDHCIGTTSCVEMHGYSELYFNAFSLVGSQSAVIGFNLNLNSPSSAPSSEPSPFLLYFQCTPSTSSVAAAPWKLLKSYSSSSSATMTQYPSERLILPTECDGAKSTNLVFTVRSFT